MPLNFEPIRPVFSIAISVYQLLSVWFLLKIIQRTHLIAHFARIFFCTGQAHEPSTITMTTNTSTNEESSSSSTSLVTSETFQQVGWQSKNKRAPSPLDDMAKRTKYSVLVNESDLSNKADQNDDDNNEDQSVPKPPSPPPIFIPRVTNISDMIKTLRQVIDYNEFSHKTFPNGDVRVKVKSIDGYRALTKHLDKHNINFHTYQLKNKRAYRVVLRHLHHTYCVDTLKAAIELLGHKSDKSCDQNFLSISILC